jgi:hypothetical protein
MYWKNWLMAGLIFCTVCVAADFAFTNIIVLGSPVSDSARIQNLLTNESGEIPIFGSSKAHGHYIPADMGIKAFNYGMDSASFEVTYALLQIELAKSRTTPLIVELELWDTGTLGEKGRFIPFVRLLAIHHLLEYYHGTDWRYYLPGLRYYGYYDVFLHKYLSLKSNIVKINQGFSEDVPLPPYDPAKMEQYIQQRLKTTTGYYENQEHNDRLTQEITSHPQRLFLLIASPYHPACFTHFQNEDQFQIWESRLAGLSNVVVLDFSHHPYPAEDWLDTIHLRRVGASDFSKEVGVKIRDILRERNGQPVAPPSGPIIIK